MALDKKSGGIIFTKAGLTGPPGGVKRGGGGGEGLPLDFKPEKRLKFGKFRSYTKLQSIGYFLTL